MNSIKILSFLFIILFILKCANAQNVTIDMINNIDQKILDLKDAINLTFLISLAIILFCKFFSLLKNQKGALIHFYFVMKFDNKIFFFQILILKYKVMQAGFAMLEAGSVTERDSANVVFKVKKQNTKQKTKNKTYKKIKKRTFWMYCL